jgi:outer membrane biosynthesis protein TonB
MATMRARFGVMLLVVAGPALANSVLVVAENELAREAAAELVEPFNGAKVKMKFAGPQAPATQCLMRTSGERARCLAQAGETAFVEAVLQVGAVASKGRTTVTFSLLSLDEGRLIKREVATGPSDKLGAALKPVATRLAKLIKPRAKPEPKPEVARPEPVAKPEPKPEPVARTEPRPVEPTTPSDAPRATPLEPQTTPPPPSLVEPAPPAGSGLRAAAWTTTGLAVAAAGVAGTFGALGVSAQSELNRNEGGVSPLSRSQANALAAQANTNLSVALGAGIGAGVLGVVSAILWSQVP